MELFSELFTVVLLAVILTMLVKFLGGNLAYFVRYMFTFRDPNLHWDPSAGMPESWSRRRSATYLDASDWAERNT